MLNWLCLDGDRHVLGAHWLRRKRWTLVAYNWLELLWDNWLLPKIVHWSHRSLVLVKIRVDVLAVKWSYRLLLRINIFETSLFRLINSERRQLRSLSIASYHLVTRRLLMRKWLFALVSNPLPRKFCSEARFSVKIFSKALDRELSHSLKVSSIDYIS